MNLQHKSIGRVVSLLLFAVAFAYVEAAVVVYLRALYYPDGFSLPLRLVSTPHLVVELGREFSTLVMLATVGYLGGRTGWTRFGVFCVAFGVWDVFYYVWLKVFLGWPSSMLEWDVLFLIPVPWIGPVIAPLMISAAMILSGVLVLAHISKGGIFRPPAESWILSVAGIAFILYTFMSDFGATLHGELPAPYRYDLFGVGLFFLAAALARSGVLHRSEPHA